MRVDITSLAADDEAQRAWATSPPLSEVRPGDRVNDLAWWGNREKKEDFSSGRHQAALHLYERIALNTQEGLLPPRCFPALFEFSDGRRRRPDKGWVKAALGNGIISARIDGQLLFEIVGPAIPPRP